MENAMRDSLFQFKNAKRVGEDGSPEHSLMTPNIYKRDKSATGINRYL